MRRRLVLAFIVVAVLGGAAQLRPVQRTNPPVVAPLRAPAQIEAILVRSCSDCHPNETRWPWYAYVAPASWLVTRDVKVGRDNLDFSYWGQLPAAEQRHLAESIVREVTAGRMPLRAYRILHPEARLSTSEVHELREWFNSPDAAPGPIDSLTSPHVSADEDWAAETWRSR